MGDGSKKFLSDFYLKSFDHTTFESFTAAGPDRKASAIIEEFHKLAKEFPAASLEECGSIPDKLWNGLKEIGIFGLNIPEQYGGVGLSLTQYLKVLKEMAGIDLALSLIPTAHLSIGTKGIVLFGNEAQKEKYLTKAASGEMLFAYALTEPTVGSDAKHITTTALLAKDKSHYVLNGHKAYITNGGYAGGLVVFAQLNPDKSGHMGAFIVETGSEGVMIGKDLDKMGLKISSTTAISFKEVKVPVENLLGKPGDGFKIAMTILNYGRLGLGAASSGVMEQAGKEMLSRAGSRKQFGKLIKEFELIQDKIVRTRVHAKVTEAMTDFTAHLLEHEPLANVAIESSHTKLFGTIRGWDALYEAQQTAGGAGYLTGLPCEKRLRDFRVTTIFEGTTEIHTIYPPLLLARDLTSIENHKKKGKGIGLTNWVSDLVHRPSFDLILQEEAMRQAADFAVDNARLIKKKVIWATLRYGKNIAEHEFFLSRITSLSLYTYGILALLAVIESRRKQGLEIAEELLILEYFVAEAGQKRLEANSDLHESREKIHHRLFKLIDKLNGQAGKGEKND